MSLYLQITKCCFAKEFLLQLLFIKKYLFHYHFIKAITWVWKLKWIMAVSNRKKKKNQKQLVCKVLKKCGMTAVCWWLVPHKKHNAYISKNSGHATDATNYFCVERPDLMDCHELCSCLYVQCWLYVWGSIGRSWSLWDILKQHCFHQHWLSNENTATPIFIWQAEPC